MRAFEQRHRRVDLVAAAQSVAVQLDRGAVHGRAREDRVVQRRLVVRAVAEHLRQIGVRERIDEAACAEVAHERGVVAPCARDVAARPFADERRLVEAPRADVVHRAEHDVPVVGCEELPQGVLVAGDPVHLQAKQHGHARALRLLDQPHVVGDAARHVVAPVLIRHRCHRRVGVGVPPAVEHLVRLFEPEEVLRDAHRRHAALGAGAHVLVDARAGHRRLFAVRLQMRVAIDHGRPNPRPLPYEGRGAPIGESPPGCGAAPTAGACGNRSWST